MPVIGLVEHSDGVPDEGQQPLGQGLIPAHACAAQRHCRAARAQSTLQGVQYKLLSQTLLQCKCTCGARTDVMSADACVAQRHCRMAMNHACRLLQVSSAGLDR